MRISYEQIQAFVAVADSGSFSAAAKQLGKHRTTLGQVITNLEIEINMPLFDRSGRYPILTSEGKSLYQQAKALSAASSAFEQLCLYQEKGIETELIVYYSEQIPAQLIVTIMEQLRKRYSQVRVHWLKGGNAEILAALQDNQADLALVVCPNGDAVSSIDFTYLLSLPFSLCASPAFMQKEKPAGLAALQQLPQLVLNDYYHSGISRSVCTSNYIQKFDSLHLLLQLLKAGEGWAILPSHSVEPALECKQLEEIPLKELGTALRFPVVLWQTSTSMGPVASYIIELIKQYSPQYEAI
ncbi:LysR family transcriptional regulator [Vibrio sp. CAU 1672]|uniref:LysR family transcriptional regulator n=1 Tax=Vibrio sp. CAU 1672 TaxID=3032594 RepID=UPI0023DC32EA|nr:LysR family transcriptional regulator [Vibrio sp. CAU 1672]MDF2153481.1 LysR family transcriptional regulator [Vibrio sp. CAU 1672]